MAGIFMSATKGDSRHGWLLALPLLAACAHGPNCDDLVPLARDAALKSQQHCNLSDENWPLCGEADGAAMHLAQVVNAACGVK